MTTIAFKDGILAADTLRSSSHQRDGFVHKIWRVNDHTIAGATGFSSLSLRFYEWTVRGMNGDSPYYGVKESMTGNGLTITLGEPPCLYGDMGKWHVTGVDMLAMGSGEEFAMGAMASGQSAEFAVAIAMRFDLHTGGAVDTIKLDGYVWPELSPFPCGVRENLTTGDVDPDYARRRVVNTHYDGSR